MVILKLEIKIDFLSISFIKVGWVFFTNWNYILLCQCVPYFRASLKQQKFMYSLSAKLGPLTCEAVGESMEDALQFLTLHLKAFIK